MEPQALAFLGAGLGAGLIALGTGLGIGLLAGPAMEGTARQPEATNDIRTSMIIAAALIEGVALFGLVVCFFADFRLKPPVRSGDLLSLSVRVGL